MIKGICKLCQTEKELLNRAHIIPDWMYFGLFDQKHRIIQADLNEKERPKLQPTGIYDKGIFCESCDNNILGSLENYGKQVLCENNVFRNFFEEKVITENGGLKSAHLNVGNYLEFKLFLVSLLWKMHISNQHIFSQVNLGDLHSERIRTMILNHDHITGEEYEVAIIGIEKIPDLITNMITTPKKIKNGNNSYYVCLINGLVFMFNISRVDKMELITKSAIKENGHFLVPLLEGVMAKFFFDSLTGVQIRKNIS